MPTIKDALDIIGKLHSAALGGHRCGHQRPLYSVK